MPSPHRSHPATTARLVRWGLGILAFVAVFLFIPTTAWAMFTSQTTTTASVTAASDWTPPTVSVDNPGAAIRGTASIGATASDAETGVNNVALAWARNGTTTWTALCSDPSNPYSCSFNTVGVADGFVDLRATATDNAGYSATATLAHIALDNTAPTGALDPIASPMNGTVTLTATASDATSGVASVAIQRSLAGVGSWTTICTDTTSPYSCSFASTGVADGLYDFRAIVTDVAGNTFTTATVQNRVVSNVAPTVTMDNPGASLRGTVTLTASASAATGVTSVRIQQSVTGSSTWNDVCTDTSSPYACTWNTTTVTDGSYSFRAIVTDALGVTATSSVAGPSTVGNAPVAGVDVQTTSGGTAGKLTANDTIKYTYGSAVKLTSILAGWDGTARAVVVRVRDGALLSLTNTDDTLDVFTTSAYTTAVNLGSINLKGDFENPNKTSAVNATMTASGNTITLTLGTNAAGGGDLKTVSGNTTMVWTPSALVLDNYDIPVSTAPVTETGTADRDF